MSDITMKKERPKHLDLRVIKQPLPAIASILHRISGAGLFLMLPFLIYLLELSLDSDLGFAIFKAWVAHPLVKLVLLGLLWALPGLAAFDHQHRAWSELLTRHVVYAPGGNASGVRYAALKDERARLGAYLATLSEPALREAVDRVAEALSAIATATAWAAGGRSSSPTAASPWSCWGSLRRGQGRRRWVSWWPSSRSSTA